MTFLLLLTESPSPAPAPTEMEPWEVSPGLLGFVFGFFLLALAVVPLFLSMTKHMRRVDHNERLRQRAEAEADGGADIPGEVPGARGPAAGETVGPDGERPRLGGEAEHERSDDGGPARPVPQSPID